MASSQQSPSEQLTHTTTRIECNLLDGGQSTGTGFFFSFKIGKITVPVIITNKHVIDNAESIKFVLNEVDEKGIRLNKKHVNAMIQKEYISKRVIRHPDEDVDLCIITINGVLNNIQKAGTQTYFKFLDSSLIPDNQQWDALTPLEEIIMIGYPNGIWDSVNNLPISRKGMTATHPSIDYEGKSQFVIDASVYPGSSGSPVFIFNQGSYSTPQGISMGTRLMLLGITFGVYQHKTTGDIVVEDIPTTQKSTAISQIPNNLGLVVKSSRILDFEPILQDIVQKEIDAKANSK